MSRRRRPAGAAPQRRPPNGPAQLHGDKFGRDHGYTAKAGILHWGITLADGPPKRWLDCSVL